MSKLTMVAVAMLVVALVLIAVACFDGRTRGWWATRIELTIAIGVILLAGWFEVIGPGEPSLSGGEPIRLGPLLVWSWPFELIAALLGAVVGLAWMIRIYRSPREPVPPPWRFRDR